jgi:hypothetical protein
VKVGGASGPPPAPGGLGGRPLEITIPDANSPNKFLPSNPRQGKPQPQPAFIHLEIRHFVWTTLMKILRLSNFYGKSALPSNNIIFFFLSVASIGMSLLYCNCCF